MCVHININVLQFREFYIIINIIILYITFKITSKYFLVLLCVLWLLHILYVFETYLLFLIEQFIACFYSIIKIIVT